MRQLEIYRNICQNIKDKRYDAVWHDSFLLDGGEKLRRYLVYDAESDNAILLNGTPDSILQHMANVAFSGV